MYCFILDIYFCSIVFIAVVPNKNKPELNAIFESNSVKDFCMYINISMSNGYIPWAL